MNFEILIAGAGKNVLEGTDGDNRIEGGAGADIIHGFAGDDLLFEDSGADKLYGGDEMTHPVGAMAATAMIVFFGGNDNDVISGGRRK